MEDLAGTRPDQTVWSGYGAGYGFAPLVLPVVALVLLRRRRVGVSRGSG